MFYDERPDFLFGKPYIVRSRGIAEAGGNGLCGVVLEVGRHGFGKIFLGGIRDDHKIFLGFDGVHRVGACDHFLVNFLARADANHGMLAIWPDGFGDLGNAVGWNLRNENLTTQGVLQREENHIDAFLEGDVETGHFGIGDGQDAGFPFFQKEGDHGSAGAHDISVADDAEGEIAVAADVVCGDEEFVGAKLGGPVEVDGRGGFVGAQRDDSLHADGHGGFDDILRSKHIGLDTLEGIVFGGGDLLERGGMDDGIDAFHGEAETIAVAHIANEEAKIRILRGGIVLVHLELLQFVAGVDDDAANVGMLAEQDFDEFFPEGSGAAGDEDGVHGCCDGHKRG